MDDARTRYTFFIEPDLRAALAAIKERDGISESEQIRRAIRAWVEDKDVALPKRATATKRVKGR